MRIGKRQTFLNVAVAMTFICVIAACASGRHLPERASEKAVTLIYTADTNGYLQACGCTGKQVGGLAKRATLLNQIAETARRNHDEVFRVDGGNLASESEISEAVLESLRIMKYVGVAVGAEERKHLTNFVQSSKERNLTVFSCTTSLSAPGKGRGGDISPNLLLIPVVNRSKANDNPTATLLPEVLVTSVGPVSPAEAVSALKRGLGRLDTRSKLVVVLSQMKTTEEEAAVLNSPDLQGKIAFWVGMRDRSDNVARTVAGCRMLPITRKGEVGILRLWKDKTDHGGVGYENHLETVTDETPADTKVQDVVSAYYARQQARLQEASQVSQGDAWALKYSPSSTCIDCHATQVAQWQQTKHFQAARTLETKQRLVPACLPCHSELYRRTKTFDKTLAIAWHGIECSTCHGDGSVHIALRTKETIKRSPGEAGCRRCHDKENDPNFDYASYLERIRHWPKSAVAGGQKL